MITPTSKARTWNDGDALDPVLVRGRQTRMCAARDVKCMHALLVHPRIQHITVHQQLPAIVIYVDNEVRTSDLGRNIVDLKRVGYIPRVRVQQCDGIVVAGRYQHSRMGCNGAHVRCMLGTCIRETESL